MKQHRGVMILVFGLLGWFLCPIFGILAWVWGNADLAEMRAGRMDPSGEGLTSAGRIIGMINVILAIVGLVFFLFMTVLAGGVAATSG